MASSSPRPAPNYDPFPPGQSQHINEKTPAQEPLQFTIALRLGYDLGNITVHPPPDE